jgi:hypothetical protein
MSPSPQTHLWHQNPIRLLAENDKMIRECVGKCNGPVRAKTTLKINKVGRLTLLHFKTCYKATVIMVRWDFDIKQTFG